MRWTVKFGNLKHGNLVRLEKGHIAVGKCIGFGERTKQERTVRVVCRVRRRDLSLVGVAIDAVTGAGAVTADVNAFTTAAVGTLSLGFWHNIGFAGNGGQTVVVNTGRLCYREFGVLCAGGERNPILIADCRKI